MNSKKINVDYYSDVLCVWAWIAQRRIDELNETLGDKVNFHFHYVDVFGDTAGKMQKQWADKGGYLGFSQHVIDSAAAFDDAPVTPEIWKTVRPKTSSSAHHFLKAVEITLGDKAGEAMAKAVRKAFFVDAKDISDREVLMSLLQAQGWDSAAVEVSLNDGTAMAALMQSYQQASQNNIKGSPTFVMDNGRLTLYGNVGYRSLYANIIELLKHSPAEASWC